MKNLKRILAALLALTMLFSMAAISEELPVQEQPEESEQVEAQTEEAPEASAEEYAEEGAPEEFIEEEPAEEPVEDEAAEEPVEAEPTEESEEEGPVEEPVEGSVEEPVEEPEQSEPESEQEISIEMEAINADSDFVIDENGVLTGYTGAGGDVTIPDGITCIGGGAFKGRNTLTSVTIPSEVAEIRASAFENCTALESVTIAGDGVTIGNSTFLNCDKLQRVDFAGSVVSIGTEAFKNCGALTEIAISGDGLAIGSSAFRYCYGLKTLRLSGEKLKIGSYAFQGSALESLTIEGSVASISYQAFQYTNIGSVSIAGDGLQIYDSAFSGCKSLRTVDFTGTVANIGKEAFKDCPFDDLALTGDGLTIGDSAFAGCYSLKHVNISGSIASLGAKGFESCDNLQAVKLAEGFEALPAGLFRKCGKLQSFTFPSTVKTIEADVFSGCKFLYLKIPATVEKIDQNALRDFSVSCVYVEKGSAGEKFCEERGIPHKTPDDQAEIKFVGVRDGDEVYGLATFLHWTAIPGAQQYNLTIAYNGYTWRYVFKKNQGEIGFMPYNAFTDSEKDEAVLYITATKQDKKTNTSVKLAEGTIVLRPNQAYGPNKVSLSSKSLKLGVGQTQQLNCTLTPAETPMLRLAYSSSKPKIASVSEEGVVTALAKGSATITVEALNGKTAKCKVTVSKAPTKVSLNKSTLTLAEQQTAKLKATISSGSKGSLSWESSNPDVAAVDQQGNITAIGAGETTISVRTHNYEPSKPKLLASCALTVKLAPKTLGVPEALTLGKGEKLTLAPEIDEGSMCSFTFSSSAKKTVSVDSKGKLTAKKTGSAIITVETHNGLKRQCTVTVAAAPKKLSVSAKNLTLAAGASQTVSVALPAATASYKLTPSSNKPKIATVEPSPDKPGEFTIKGVAPGKATITIKTFNGKKATVSVTVS